jgi:hypothetical protein
MGIRWERIEDEDVLGGLICPYFECDACGEKIEEHGKAVFEEDKKFHRTGRYWTFHKSRECELSEPNTRMMPWQDLDDLLYELWQNSKFDWEAVEKRRARDAEHGINN